MNYRIKRCVAFLMLLCLMAGSVWLNMPTAKAIEWSDISPKQQAVLLNAIKAALNTATLKKLVPAFVEKLNAGGIGTLVDIPTDSATTIKKKTIAFIKSGEDPGGPPLVSVTKAAGGKWNIQIIESDLTTGSVIKEDIPKAAVEKPTLSTDPTVNSNHTHSGGEATCISRPICSSCHAEYGSPLGHDWGGWESIGENQQMRKCNRCQSTTDEK